MSVLARRVATRSRRRTANVGIGALFDEHAPMVLAICRYLLRDPQAAEDAAQETFLSAHRSLLGGTEPRDAPAWLATIARNECRRAWRKAPPPPLELVTADTLHDPADIVEERADLSAVATAIGRLPERQREALVLREFCGLTYDQVAAAMSVSRPVVDSLLSRARRGLTERVGYIPKAARGALVLPPSFRDELARLIPGLDSADTAAAAGVASAGGGATLLGLGSGPVAVKVAATGVAAVALALPVQATMRSDEGPRIAEPPKSAARAAVRRPSADREFVAITPVAALSTTRATPSRRPARRPAKADADDSASSSHSGHRDSPAPGPGSSSSSGPGPSGSGSGSSGSGSGSGSGSSGSGSGSSGSGSGSSGSSDSRSSNSGPGSGSSGPGSGGEAIVATVTPTGSSSGPGSSGSGSGSTGSGSSGSGSSGSGSSGSGSSGSGSGDSPDDD
jgi:RNA polymerase sigma factor (sigma-70 family)